MNHLIKKYSDKVELNIKFSSLEDTFVLQYGNRNASKLRNSLLMFGELCCMENYIIKIFCCNKYFVLF